MSVAKETASSEPLSAATVNVVTIVAVDMAVTRPFALTVITGIDVVLPKLPVLLLTVANVNAPDVAIVASPDTSAVTTKVPVELGKVIVLSAVGSVTAKVVSKLSAVEPSNIKLVTVGLASKAIDISLFETVVVMFEPPEKSKISVASDTVSFAPLSAPTVKVFVIDAVDPAVPSPFQFPVQLVLL